MTWCPKRRKQVFDQPFLVATRALYAQAWQFWMQSFGYTAREQDGDIGRALQAVRDAFPTLFPS